jgi:nucleotide-binding universal stress UspA family protein
MISFPTKILLATDGSEDASQAARVAADLSQRTGSELHVVHAWRPLPQYAYPSLVSERYYPPYERGATMLLDEQVKSVEEAGATVAEAHLRAGAPSDAILDLAEELGPGLLVVGSRGTGAIERLLTGSVSEALVHHAACPVLVVRGGERAWPPERVVVGDDGSETARQAGDLAAAIGGLFGARMLIVRAQPKPPRPPELPEYEEEIYDRLVREDEQRGTEALNERAGELTETLGVRPEAWVQVDYEPTVAILVAGDRVASTLTAVGSRGLGPIRRSRLGSVSTKVLRAAEGPVLVCPPLRKGGARRTS